MACVVVGAAAAVTGAGDGADAHKEFHCHRRRLLLLQSTVECFVDVGTAADAAAAVVVVLRIDCPGSCSSRLAGRKQRAQWQTEQIHGRPQTIALDGPSVRLW